MKQARIVERGPSHSGRHVWYVLVATDASESGGAPLQHESVRYVERRRGVVDPAGKAAALARLGAWAERNGWMIVGEG